MEQVVSLIPQKISLKIKSFKLEEKLVSVKNFQ
jgi:hypothetical protein